MRHNTSTLDSSCERPASGFGSKIYSTTVMRRTETEESTGTAISEDYQSAYEDEAEDESSGSRTPSMAPNNRDAHFTKKILDRTGRCIRLSLTPLKLFERVHLVFYRSAEWT